MSTAEPPATRRALVLGCVAEDLPGVAESARRMAKLLLEGYGFTALIELIGADTTAEQIVSAFVELLRVTREGDAVVFYYAGHGGMFHVRQPGAAYLRKAAVQAPALRESGLAGFRGILGSELSRWLDALAERTANVTVILDCCGAADLLRVGDRGIRHPCTLAFDAELRASAKRSTVTRGGDHGGPRIALLLASTSGSRSYPDPNSEELLFSRLLCDELQDRERAARSTWDELVLRLREQTRQQWPQQLSGVEGARFRLPFTTDVGCPTSDYYLGAVREGRFVVVEAGAFAGIAEGDEFEVVIHGWDHERDGRRIATGTVDTVGASEFTLHLTKITVIPPKVVHVRRLAVTPQSALYIDPAVDSALPDWRPGAQWQRSPSNDAAAHVLLTPEGGAIDVRDLHGELIARVELGADAAPRLDAALARAACWAQVWRSLHDTSVDPLGCCFEVSWGLRVARGPEASERLLAPGAAVSPSCDEVLFLSLKNPGSEPRLYARAFRVRADRAIEHWNDSAAGTAMEAGQRIYLGDTTLGGGCGIRPEWPEHLPADAFREVGAREWAILVVSTHEITRTLLPSVIERARTRGPRSVYRGHTDSDPRFTLMLIPYGLLGASSSASAGATSTPGR